MAPSSTRPLRIQQATDRWAFLRSWIVYLQEYLSYNELEELDSETLHNGLRNLCVYVPWPPEKTHAYRQKLIKLRESIELVGFMLRLDKNAWLLLKDADHNVLKDFDCDDYDVCDLQPHFLFKAYTPWKIQGDSRESIAACSVVLTENDMTSFSFAFEQARAKVVGEMDRFGRLVDYQVPISIVIYPSAMAPKHIPVYIQQAKTLVKTVCGLHSAARRGTTYPYPFKLTQVIFQPWEFRICTDPNGNDVAGLVALVLAHGAHILELAPTLLKPDARALGKLMVAATRVDRLSARVKSLYINENALPAFICVCSALATSTTLSRLQLYEALDDSQDSYRAEKWKWLGFALFSRASTTSVRELYIDDDRLLLSDIAALQSTTESPHPIQELASSHTCDEIEGDDDAKQVDDVPTRQYNRVDRQIRLSPNATLRLFSPDGEDRSLRKLAVPGCEYFQVITEDTGTDMMEILVPGYGCAWVAGEWIIDVAVVDLRPTGTPARLTSLHFAFNNCEKGALAAMIRTMGASLVSLDIDSKFTHLVRSRDVVAILETCRNLKMLRLKLANIGTMDHFTKAYAGEQCRISTLSLSNVVVSNASLCRFAQALADPSHPMAKTLIEFRYINDLLGCPGDRARPNAKGIQLFLDMLVSNHVLSFFEIGLGDDLYERFAHQFTRLDAKRLVSHPTDLPLALKLAFLSCVEVVAASGRSTSTKRRRRHQWPVLHRAVVAHIFGFARRRVLQVVSTTEIVKKQAQTVMM